MDSLLQTDMPVKERSRAPAVAFIDDVLRHAFWPAKEFFYDLLKVPFQHLLPEPARPSVRRMMWDDGLLMQPEILASPANETLDWTLQYAALSEDMKGLLQRYIDPECVYISYEASPGLQSFLTELGITYIDVRISPLRFLPDVLVAMRSNSDAINAVLASATMSRTDIQSEALLLAASWRHTERYVHWHRPKQDELPPLYYVGQTADDASIVVGQSYLRLDEVIADLAEDLAQRDIVYLRHPKADQHHMAREILALKNVSRSFRISDANSYDLLCSDRPAEFFGISSGLLQEAQFFGKPSHRMIPPVCPLFFPEEAEETATGYYQVSFDTFISESFWDCLFRGAPVKTRDTPRTMRPNQLRELHNVWWGYAPHKARPTDYSRAMMRDVHADVDRLRSTTSFLLSLLSQPPEASASHLPPFLFHSWRWVDGSEVRFTPEGGVMKNGIAGGSWRIVNGAEENAMILWSDGNWIDVIHTDPSGTILHCRNNIGHKFTVAAAPSG